MKISDITDTLLGGTKTTTTSVTTAPAAAGVVTSDTTKYWIYGLIAILVLILIFAAFMLTGNKPKKNESK